MGCTHAHYSVHDTQVLADYVFQAGSRSATPTADAILALLQRHGTLVELLAGGAGGKGTRPTGIWNVCQC
jgi:hypothetical protein